MASTVWPFSKLPPASTDMSFMGSLAALRPGPSRNFAFKAAKSKNDVGRDEGRPGEAGKTIGARVAGPLGPPRTGSGHNLVRAPSLVLTTVTRPAPYARPAAATATAAMASRVARVSPPTRTAVVEVAPARRAEVAALRTEGPARPVTGVAEVHAAALRRVDGGVWRRFCDERRPPAVQTVGGGLRADARSSGW